MKKMRKRKIICLIAGTFSILFASFTLLSLSAKEPVTVYGEELDWNHPSQSKYTNVFANGFYTTEITVRINSYANRGASYYVPYNITVDEVPKVVPDSKISNSTCMIVDGRTYLIDEEVKISQRGTHKIRVCNTIVTNGESFAGGELEEFFVYVDTSSNKIENSVLDTFYYSSYTSLNDLTKSIVENFNGTFVESDIKTSTIYGKPLNIIESKTFTKNGTPQKMTLYNALATNWNVFSRNPASLFDGSIEEYANSLKISFSLEDSFGNKKENIQVLTVEDPSATGDISFKLKEKAAFVFDTINGTTIPRNNTDFVYSPDSYAKVSDMLNEWTHSSGIANRYKYNILNCFDFSCSGNRWFVDNTRNGQKIDINNYKDFAFSFSGEVLEKRLSTTNACEFIGKVNVSISLNKVFGSDSPSSFTVAVPVFLVRRISVSNAASFISIPQNLEFKQGVNVSYNSANTEVLNYIYNASEKYTYINFPYLSEDGFRDYSSFPNFESAFYVGTSLNATRPGIYGINFSLTDFYEKDCSCVSQIKIKDENNPKIIAKYDVLYLPVSKKTVLIEKLSSYFKIIDDVEVADFSYTFSNSNWLNSDIREVAINFNAVDSSGNTATESYVVNFYNDENQGWWETHINPGLYKYKKWFLGLFGLNAN